MIRYEKLRSYLRDHIAAQTDFTAALVQLDDGLGNDAFQAAIAAAQTAVAILPIYAVELQATAGIAPNVVTVVRAQFLVEIAVSPTVEQEEFDRLCTMLYGALSNFYQDDQDLTNSIAIGSGEMSFLARSEGLRAFVFDCEKFCVMTPNTPAE